MSKTADVASELSVHFFESLKLDAMLEAAKETEEYAHLLRVIEHRLAIEINQLSGYELHAFMETTDVFIDHGECELCKCNRCGVKKDRDFITNGSAICNDCYKELLTKYHW